MAAAVLLMRGGSTHRGVHRVTKFGNLRKGVKMMARCELLVMFVNAKNLLTS